MVGLANMRNLCLLMVDSTPLWAAYGGPGGGLNQSGRQRRP